MAVALADLFATRVRDRFEFLTRDYGFALAESSRSGWEWASIRYVGKRVGVEIVLDKEEIVDVYLQLLANGTPPPSHDTSRSFLLDNVISGRAAGWQSPQREGIELDPQRLEHLLSVYSEALRAYASDILEEVPETLEELVTATHAAEVSSSLARWLAFVQQIERGDDIDLNTYLEGITNRARLDAVLPSRDRALASRLEDLDRRYTAATRPLQTLDPSRLVLSGHRWARVPTALRIRLRAALVRRGWREQ